MKILNIASSDNFDDILEAVKESKSTEVILVIPKSNRVFKNKNKAEQLRANFEKLNKEVSIISSGGEVIKNADQAGFNIIRRSEKSSNKKDNDIVSLYSEKEPEEKEFFQAIRRPITALKRADSKSLKNFIFIFLGIAFLFFVVIIFTFMSEARVKIFPHKNEFSINIPVIISDKITETDEVYGIIPGESIQIEKIISKTFNSTGEKNVFQKAKGKLKIYNNFNTSPQALVATTRFQTSQGLVFRIVKTIIVPGATEEGDKLKPGEVEAEVVADRAGEEYNIEPAEFKIPGFLGTPKYNGFYAKSFEKFSAGFIGQASIATKEDIEKAESLVKEEVANEVREELALLSNFKILDQTLDIETENMSDSGKTGDLGKEFKIGYKAKLKTIAFKEDDVSKFISQYIKNSQNLEVIGKGLRIDYQEIKFDKEDNEFSLKLVSSGQTADNIDKEKIISEIAGIKSNEAETYLSGLKEVESVEIYLSPFWARSIPKNKERVEIQIAIE